MRYELFEHTADIGIRTYGKSLEEVFENAAFAMFSLIIEKLDNIQEKTQISLRIPDKDNLQELLVAFLSELLYQFYVKELILKRFEIEDIDEHNLSCTAYGEKYDHKIHVIKREIKTITYHILKVERLEDNRWLVQIIFDV